MRTLERVLVEQGRKKVWLARATGISPKTLSRYLTGETKTVSTSWMQSAANALGCDPDELFDQAPAPQQDMVADGI